MTIFDLFCSIDWTMLLNFLLCLICDIALVASIRTTLKEHVGSFYTVLCVIFAIIITIMMILYGVCIFQPPQEVNFMYET